MVFAKTSDAALREDMQPASTRQQREKGTNSSYQVLEKYPRKGTKRGRGLGIPGKAQCYLTVFLSIVCLFN